MSFQSVGPSPRVSPPEGFGGRSPFDIIITTCTLVEFGNGIFPVNTLKQRVDLVRVRTKGRQNLWVTSIITMARAYISDCVVGFTHSSLWVVIGPKSSGADQRIEPAPGVVEPLTDEMSSAIEERPKSARKGFPCSSITILS